jgi:holliday junction DNA helicase RuvA
VIRLIRGELLEAGPESAIIEAGGVGYEVTVSELVAERLAARGPGAQVTLHIYHYLALEPSRATPVLLGFDSPEQLALFGRLISVPRLGPRQAAKLLAAPVSSIARAIELGDVRFLQSLPGVGAGKARDLINALRGKLGAFIEAAEGVPGAEAPVEAGLETDVMDVLVQLGYSLAEARQRTQAALARRPEVASTNELLAEALADRT